MTVSSSELYGACDLISDTEPAVNLLDGDSDEIKPMPTVPSDKIVVHNVSTESWY